MTILLVDDDITILEDINKSVNWQKLGVDQVLMTYDVMQAKDVLTEQPVDIVISDIEMPQASGLDLLRWYREKGMKGKFLLLTCHENFRYATEAVSLHAEEYLTKPFNVEMMELILQKFILELKQERENETAKMLGKWMSSNIREVRLNLWRQLLTNTRNAGFEELIREVQTPDLIIDESAEYCLVLSKVTNLEKDNEKFGRNLIAFILTNIQSEVFYSTPENDHIICFEHTDYYTLVAVCTETDQKILRKKCEEVLRHCEKILSSTITYCLMKPCKWEGFRPTYERGTKLLDHCISFYGEIFSEEQVQEYMSEAAPVLQQETIAAYLEQRDKKSLMAYLKRELEQRVRAKVMDSTMLKSIHREMQQAVYAHLSRQGIHISLLLNDALSERLSAKAVQSAADMMRYDNYLLDKIFDYEVEMEKSKGMIEKINEYIRDHYRENIGRNEIGAAFYLVPEYLAKMYKKKTGTGLKDAINDCRLEEAKRLLRSREKQVGEVGSEVGFENLSYFSTLFKKAAGMTPNEYRKQFE